MIDTIERARRYVAKCPPAISGQGGHDATFHVASVLVHGFALSQGEALTLLKEWNAGCVPEWTEAELVHKVVSAANASHKDLRGYLLGNGSISSGLRPPFPRSGEGSPEHGCRAKMEVRPPKPTFAPEVLKRIAQNVREVVDVMQFIRERSPVAVETQDSASVLRRLYRRGSGEKVLVFSEMNSQGQLLWEADKSDVLQNRHLPSGGEGVWFLPQPVDGELHPNPRLDGKLSRRSEESVTSWRYAVLESDKAETDDWLRCLIQMPLRIVSICESGGRSIHALVRVDASSKADWDRKVNEVKPVLVRLGADAGALSAVRLTRLPQAMRGERCQRLLYLNPEVKDVPIIQQPPQATLYGSNRRLE